MNPIRIEPQKALEDAVRFNQKLAAGLKTLRTLDDVSYGTTEKEEVYREDKLVLYRFKGSKAPTARTPLLIVKGVRAAKPTTLRPVGLPFRNTFVHRSSAAMPMSSWTVPGLKPLTWNVVR